MPWLFGGNSNDDLDMTSEQKSLINFYNLDQVDDQTEHQVPRAVEGSLEETPVVVKVFTRDKDDGEEIHGVHKKNKELLSTMWGK